MLDVMAKDVEIGDKVFVKHGNEMVTSVVEKIEVTKMTGAYVPLTEHGTIVVDGVLTSCYADVPHDLANFITTPAR